MCWSPLHPQDSWEMYFRSSRVVRQRPRRLSSCSTSAAKVSRKRGKRKARLFVLEKKISTFWPKDCRKPCFTSPWQTLRTRRFVNPGCASWTCAAVNPRRPLKPLPVVRSVGRNKPFFSKAMMWWSPAVMEPFMPPPKIKRKRPKKNLCFPRAERTLMFFRLSIFLGKPDF